MKYPVYIFFMILLFACSHPAPENDKASLLFNEGMSYSLDAEDEYSKKNTDVARALNREAISKFHAVLTVDSGFASVYGPLGHSYFLISDFRNGIKYYKKALEYEPGAAVYHLEYGLCEINLGEIPAGREEIGKALELDSGDEFLRHTINELMIISEKAYAYSKELTETGENEKSAQYLKFALKIMLLANKFDPANKLVMNRIIDMAGESGIDNLADEFRKKLKVKLGE